MKHFVGKDTDMLKSTWKALILCTVAAAMNLSGATADAGDGFFRDLFNPCSDGVQFTASEQVTFIGRDSRIGSNDTVVNGPDADAASFDSGNFDLESGYRVSLGVETPERRIEAIFADYGDWAWRNSGNMAGGLSFDADGGALAGSNSLGANTFFQPLFAAATAAADEGDGLGPNTATADPVPTYNTFYQSNLQDLQINFLDNDQCSVFRMGLGYRNLQLDELAGTTLVGAYRGFDVAAPDGGLSDADLTGAGLTLIGGAANGFDEAPGNQLTLDYSGRTDNQLNGFQVIVDTCLIDLPRFNVSVYGKAGAYHNHAVGRVRERYTQIGTDTSTYGRDFRDSKDTVAFVGGLELKAGVNLTPHLRLIGGYEGMLVSGVALAPEQSSGIRAGTYEVNADGQLIVHGANAGLELRY